METIYEKKARARWLYPLLLLVMSCLTLTATAQTKPPQKAKPKKSVYNEVPWDYNRVGQTQLYYTQDGSTIDIIGEFGGAYYSSTFSNNGYRVAIQVGDHEAVSVDDLPYLEVEGDDPPPDDVPMFAPSAGISKESPSNSIGIEVETYVEQQGEFARMCYAVTNTKEDDETISLGVHADVMIGDNDLAPITRRKDSMGNTYGLTMRDGNGAELCVLFGASLSGVSAVDDYWFGYYYTNTSPYEMVGNYYGYSDYMVEDGSYDSGMGWCWKDRTIPAGSTVVFSYLIGVGDVSLEPGSSYDITLDESDDWNDLSASHHLIVSGTYESPAGVEGVIDYSIEGSDVWQPLTGTLASGEEFSATLVALFDTSRNTHTIRFRTRDLVGNTTAMRPVEFVDIRPHTLEGLVEKTYTGDSIYQDALSSDLQEGWYDTSHYADNIDAGTATVYLEGVFPYTIGRKPYHFTILPAPLEGGIAMEVESIDFTGEAIQPDWHFTVEQYATLAEGKDYTITWTDNRLPGDATLTVSGKGNYEGTLTATFHINKIQLPESLINVTLPDAEVTYDGEPHGATIAMVEGMGTATITYVSADGQYDSTEPPTEEGTYKVYVETGEGAIYLALARRQVGTFVITLFDSEEWMVLEAVMQMGPITGWEHPWDITAGKGKVSTFDGLTVRNGHVVEIDLSNRNIKGLFWPFFVLLKRLEKLDLSHNNLQTGFSQDIFGADFTSLKELDISYNQMEGNVGVLASRCPALVHLDASHNQFADVIPMISPQVTDLHLESQAIGQPTSMTVAQLMGEAIEEHIPTILTYDHQRQAYRRDISLELTDEQSPWALRLDYGGATPQVRLLSEETAYHKESGGLLTATLADAVGLGSTFTLALDFLMGDADFSGACSVVDLQAIINYVFRDYHNRPFNYTAADLWTDNTLNVQDVVKMVDQLLDTDNEGGPALSMRKAPATATTADAEVYVEDGQLYVNSSIPVAAFDIVVDGCLSDDAAQQLEASGMTCTIRQSGATSHLVGYSLAGASLPAGITALGSLKGDVPTVRMATLADTDAVEIAAHITTATTGIAKATDGFAITLADGRLAVETSQSMKGIRWTVADLSGRIVARGTTPAISAGSHVLGKVKVAAATPLIVTFKAEGCKEYSRKTIMK